MSDDAKLASVLKCLSGQLKTQAMIHVTETSSYNDLRQLIERWDMGHARWNDALASSYGIITPKDPKDTSAPMEIDRLQKGKGKGGKKGDKGGKPKGGKGQPSGWKSTQWDSKGKDKGKGKGKGKAQDANGKGAKLCHFCQKPGHIKANCYAWKRQQGQSVQQVEQVAGSSSSSASVINSSAGSSVGTRAPGAPRVNRLELCIPEDVPVYAFGDDDDEAVDLTVFSEWYDDDSPTICAVQFSMTCTDDDECWTLPDAAFEVQVPGAMPMQVADVVQTESSDSAPVGPMQVADVVQTESSDSAPVGPVQVADVVQTESSDSAPVGSNLGHVCAVTSVVSFDPRDSSGGEPIEMVVDSGADESCVPAFMSSAGESLGNKGPGFCDAQGHPLQVHDRRTCVMQFRNVHESFKTFKETCLVSSVSSPLFAVGKLYRMGWGTFWHEGQFVLGLQGDTSTYIPCWFRHNSVVTEGWIRRVHEATPTSPKRAQSSPTSPNGAQAAFASPQVARSVPEAMQVRAITAKLGKVLERLVKNATSFVQLVEGVWGIQLETDKFKVCECS